MMLAFLDELGHAGRYVARTHENYMGSPLFGYVRVRRRPHFRRAVAREIVGLLICKLMGKPDGCYGPFWPGAATAMDDS